MKKITRILAAIALSVGLASVAVAGPAQANPNSNLAFNAVVSTTDVDWQVTNNSAGPLDVSLRYNTEDGRIWQTSIVTVQPGETVVLCLDVPIEVGNNIRLEGTLYQHTQFGTVEKFGTIRLNETR